MNYLIARFLRGGISGATGMMTVIVYNNISNWQDVGMWLNALAIALVVGFIAGILMAVDKWVRTEPSDKMLELYDVKVGNPTEEEVK